MGDYYGYRVREQIHPGELEYFRNNPHVSGMAAEDRQIIFNPFSSRDINFDSVGRNEAARLWMRENNFVPQFKLTNEQKTAFRGTEYEKDDVALKQSILGRIVSGDPSAGKTTEKQRHVADWLLKKLNERQQHDR